MISAIAKGMGTTLKMLFRRKSTIPYPEVKKPRSARFRGKHELRRYDNGLEMCIGCELCQVACPAEAITVIPAENDPQRPHSPGERYAYKYEIDMLRCIYCGFCEEACPTDALHLTQYFEMADFSRDRLIFARDKLVAEKPSTYQVPEHVYPPYTGRRPVWEEKPLAAGPEGRPKPDLNREERDERMRRRAAGMPEAGANDSGPYGMALEGKELQRP